MANEAEAHKELCGSWVRLKAAPTPPPKLLDPDLCIAAGELPPAVNQAEVQKKRTLVPPPFVGSITNEKARGERACWVMAGRAFQKLDQIFDLMGGWPKLAQPKIRAPKMLKYDVNEEGEFEVNRSSVRELSLPTNFRDLISWLTIGPIGVRRKFGGRHKVGFQQWDGIICFRAATNGLLKKMCNI